ncbi:SDR family oxidoreductase [Agrobacterium tumefaciens]|uniref:SDR family oxidoreductase n=1 Tax=Agrobacterium tumefaciens TaxID=358 RepID=UPI0015744CD1|nr:SDR family oxidoreductase [Agrobacterium tumefaciens]
MSLDQIFSVEGKKAIITGGASGLGLAIAEALLENGAHVAIIDNHAERLEAETARLTDNGFQVSAHLGDVADEAIGSIIRSAVEALGGVDIVFANAGVTGGYGPSTGKNEAGLFENIDLGAWHRTLGINLTGVVHTLKQVVPALKEQRSGRIIVTASIAGLRANPSIGYSYTASKSALVLLIKELALELAPYGVNVNGLAPGPFKTNINDGRFFNAENEAGEAATVPVGRLGEPREIKGLALLLASAASSYITGAVIPIDGGKTAGV